MRRLPGGLCCILSDAICGYALARHALRYGYAFARAYRVKVFADILAGCHIIDNTCREVAEHIRCVSGSLYCILPDAST